jgi:hypothetical protein
VFVLHQKSHGQNAELGKLLRMIEYQLLGVGFKFFFFSGVLNE